MALRLWRERICVGIGLAVLAVFMFGCAESSKEAKVKCPKCGAIFTFQEGLDEYQKGSH
jgi:hypothetical protein